MLLKTLLIASFIDTLAIASSVTTAMKPVYGSAVTSLSDEQTAVLENPKQLSALIPGLHLPDYGASLTSSIYIRGLGSRMENPVMGLYIDDFPILDKNSYDLDYLDIVSVTFLHGPQGTAYGRNAMAGVLSVRTQAPDGEKRLGLSLEGGSAWHARAQMVYRQGNWSLGAGYRHSAGYFINEFKGTLCDPYDGLQLRLRWEGQPTDSLQLSNLFQVALSSEGGFVYGAWDGKTLHPASYNDEGSYRRLSLLEGFKAHVKMKKVQLHGMGSLQVLWDRMRMDQDYLPLSIFTLEQQQRSAALTFEVLARPSSPFTHWKPLTGAFAFFKYNRMEAPVLFKREGIQQLILDNANAGIPDEFGVLDIMDQSFPVTSLFDILSWNAALFHESVFTVGDWRFVAGLRLDYEGAWMHYHSEAGLTYQLAPMMERPRFFSDTYRGTLSHGSLVLLPKVSVQYEGFPYLQLFATVSKGYRAGGFNTQIFSDILQGRLMTGMMADMGVYPDRPPVSVLADHTEYKPEEAWNFEIGAHYARGGFQGSLNAFWMEAVNQQLTVFPPGKATGRMMTNAGRSRSLGLEASAFYRKDGFMAQVSWGWNDARFREYSDGLADYAGNRIPYSPAHTLFVRTGYSWEHFSLEVHARGTGTIAWNESNTLEEPFYVLPGAQATLTLGKWQLYVRGENLTGTEYRSFYFKSMGNEFFQAGKPARVLAGVKIQIL